MNQPDQTSLEKQLLAHRRRLDILKTQLAAKGTLNADPQLIIETEDLRKIINELSGAPPSGAAQTYLRALELGFEEFKVLVKPVDLATQPGKRSPETVMTPEQRRRLAHYLIQPHYAPSPDINAKKTNVEKFLVDNKRVVLLGSPGAGKSTTLRQLALRWRTPETLPEKLRDKTPIFAALNVWYKSMNLEEFLTKQVMEAGGEELARRIPNLLKEGQALLLLDGLNELPGGIERDEKSGEVTDERVKEIKELCQINDLSCLLSCRVKDFGEAINWHDLHVLPLEREQVEKIAAAFFLGDEALQQGFISELYHKKRQEERQHKLREMAEQPFYLLHVLAYYMANQNLPDSPALALEYAVDEALKKLTPELITELIERLALLAFNMTDSGQVGADLKVAAGWLFSLREKKSEFEEFSKDKEPQASPEEQKQATSLLKLAEDTYLTSEVGGIVQFRHQLLQEYFCAFYIKKSLDSALLERTTYSRFWEAWPLLAGLDKGLVDRLINWLKDSHVTVRSSAAVTLGYIGDARAVEPLIQALNDENEYVRYFAAVTLGRIGDSRAVQPLIQTLKDKDRDVRYIAADALGKIGDAKVVEPLIQALKDKDEYVRYNAVVALGNIGYIAALPYLDALRQDTAIGNPYSEKTVGEMAEFAIREIKRKNSSI